jgi:hypothetical protein
MPEDVLTVSRATTIRDGGRAEFSAGTASISPDRHRFHTFDELKTYLQHTFGARAEGEGVRGSMSRRGPYSRRAANGDPVVTFGDPVLDAISSADGSLVVGNETINLREGSGSPAARAGADGTVGAQAASSLQHTGTVNGAERWAADDGSRVEYRLGTGRLVFQAWRNRNISGYWSIGAEILVVKTPAKFQVADIESRYYMSVGAPCKIVRIDHDSDRNDDYLEEYEWGWNAQQPKRVASLCRARWHNALFADVVTAGSGCEDAPNDPTNPWTPGFPPDWTPKSTVVNLTGDWTDGSGRNAAISVDLSSLSVNMSAFNRPAARGSIVDWSTIEVTFPDDRTYTAQVQPPHQIRWSNNSAWTKVVNTVIDLNGDWTDGSGRTARIAAGAKALKLDMSDFDRSNANGSIVNSSSITVTFPDDTTYTGQVQTPNKIVWSNGSVWVKKA